MAYGEIPRGLEDLRVAPVTGVGNTVGTFADVPGVRTFEVNISQDADRLEGDNKVIAVAPSAKSLSGSIELGQINLAALAVMKGGTVATTGTTPDAVSELDEEDTLVIKYFCIQTAAPSADVAGSEYQIEVKKVLATGGLSETMTVNDWDTPGIDYEGVAVAGVLMTRRQFETAEGLPYTP